MVLVPDPAQRGLYAQAIADNLKAGDALFFAHGFNIRFGYIQPPADVDVCMVARRVRAIWCGASTPPVAVCRASWPSNRTPLATPGR